MKHLIIFFLFTGTFFTVSAQSDSLASKPTIMKDSTPPSATNTMNTMRIDSTGSANNSMKTDSAGSVTNTMNTGVSNDSMHATNNVMKQDSGSIMTNAVPNNAMKTDSTATTNNTSVKTDSSSMQTNSAAGTTNTSVKTDSSSMQTNSAAGTTNQVTSPNVNQDANRAVSTPATGVMINSQNVAGQAGYASLPILESYVPADVVAKVKAKYTSVYDISYIKHTADQGAYVVRYGDNGVYKTEMVGEDGNTIQ